MIIFPCGEFRDDVSDADPEEQVMSFRLYIPREYVRADGKRESRYCQEWFMPIRLDISRERLRGHKVRPTKM